MKARQEYSTNDNQPEEHSKIMPVGRFEEVDEPLIGTPEWEKRIDELIASADFPGSDTGGTQANDEDYAGSDPSDIYHTPMPHPNHRWDNRPWGHYDCLDTVASSMKSAQDKWDATVLGQIIIDYFESDPSMWFEGQDPIPHEQHSPLVQRVEAALTTDALATIQDRTRYYANIIDEAAKFAARLDTDNQSTVVATLLQHYVEHFDQSQRPLGMVAIQGELKLTLWPHGDDPSLQVSYDTNPSDD